MKSKPKLSVLLQELKDQRLKDPKISMEEKEEIKIERRNKLRKKIMDLYDDNEETLTEAEQLNKSIKILKRKCDA